jgi:uncharacterized protein (TIGR03435 family)
MTNRIVQTLNLGRKMLLAGVGMVAVAGPIAVGIGARQASAQTPQSPPAFDVVSVKPYKSLNPGRGGDLRDPMFLAGGRFISRAPLIMVIAAAYAVPFFGSAARISGGPAWINSLDLVYDIQAVPAKDAAPDGLSASAQANKRRQMLQALLADCFKLVVRRETKEMPVYVVTVGKGGPKLPKADIQEKDCPEASAANAPADGNAVCHRFNGGRGRGLHARAVDMSDLVNFVQGWTDLPLFEETGLTGLYHIETEPWLPMELGSSRTNVDGADVANLPTLFTVFERLGLKMVSQKRNVDRYVIDHVEKPTEN